ncbi:MAG: hypothetical protein P8Y73_05515 [Desulfuromonadales bacterium]
MSRSLLAFNTTNRHFILTLFLSHLVWGCVVIGLWAFGQLLPMRPGWSLLFIGLQFYTASQLILAALRLQPEVRSRGFYLIWGLIMITGVWLINRIAPEGGWLLPVAVSRSAVLLLVGTFIGAALARFIKQLWQLVPVCLVMVAADFFSWLKGPTAGFASEIAQYYRTFEGPPPLVDMLLVKMAVPGQVQLLPVFGLSDWIMVVFFAIVARHHQINDNLLGRAGEVLARRGQIGGYLPVAAAALFLAVILAQSTGQFLPALPVIALMMLLWYGVRSMRQRMQSVNRFEDRSNGQERGQK